MNILSWVLFGMIVGIISAAIDNSERGIVMYVLLGTGGALIGGLIANYIFMTDITGFNTQAFLLASISAITLLFLSKFLKKGVRKV